MAFLFLSLTLRRGGRGRYFLGSKGLSKRSLTASEMGSSKMLRTTLWTGSGICISANSCSISSANCWSVYSSIVAMLSMGYSLHAHSLNGGFILREKLSQHRRELMYSPLLQSYMPTPNHRRGIVVYHSVRLSHKIYRVPEYYGRAGSLTGEPCSKCRNSSFHRALFRQLLSRRKYCGPSCRTVNTTGMRLPCISLKGRAAPALIIYVRRALSLRLLMDHNLVHSRGVLAHFDLLTFSGGGSGTL